MKGIYKIKNKINGKVYIGQSMDIEERWEEHKHMLKTGTHHSYKLQQDYNSYGLLGFDFEIIKDITNDRFEHGKCRMMLLAYEGYYMKQYNSIEEGYNVEFTLNEILFTDRLVFDSKVKQNKKKYTDMKLTLLGYYLNIITNNGECKKEYFIPPSQAKKRQPYELMSILQPYALDRPYDEVLQFLVDCKYIVDGEVIDKFKGYIWTHNEEGIKARKLRVYISDEIKEAMIKFLKANKIILHERVNMYYEKDYKNRKLVKIKNNDLLNEYL